MGLVQISEHRLEAEKVPRGERPVWEIDLDANQRIIGHLYRFDTDHHDRKTVDHHITILVETRL